MWSRCRKDGETLSRSLLNRGASATLVPSHSMIQHSFYPLRFSIYGVSVCVLNSHLAAHDHQQAARVESYNTVLGSHTFANKAMVRIRIKRKAARIRMERCGSGSGLFLRA